MDNDFELLRRIVTLEVQLADLTRKMEALLAKPPETSPAWPWARLALQDEAALRREVEEGHVVATALGTQRYSRGSWAAGSDVSRETPKGMNGAGGPNG